MVGVRVPLPDPALGERVLALASALRDARLDPEALRAAGAPVHPCASVPLLCTEAERGAGALLLGGAGLSEELPPVAAMLASQPHWSDLPVLVLVDPSCELPPAIAALELMGSVVTMPQDARPGLVAGALRAALRARRRQYESRDHVEAGSLLAALVQSSDDAIVSCTPDGVVLSWNAGAERLFGYEAAAMVGRPLDVLVPVDLRDGARATFAEVAAGRRVAPFETERLTRDGRRLELSVTLSPIRDATGRVVAVSKVSRDVGARLRAERAARTAQDLLELITDNLPPLISYIDDRLRYQLNNRAYETWFGLDREAIRGQHVRDVLGEEAWRRLRPYMEAALAGRRTQFEAEIPYQHGGTRWIEASYVPDVAEDGSVRGFAVLIGDITQRRRAEQALRESETRFRLMADAAPVLIWLSDGQGRRTWFNRMWLDFTGRPPEQELGVGWREGVHLDDANPLDAALAEAFAAREPVRLEYRLRRADGAYRWMLETAQPMLAPDGAFLGFIGSSTDVTEWHEVTALLRASDRRKDEFLATLGHELRNPLAPIRNSLHILRIAEGDEAQRQLVAMMERQVDQLVRLVDDLLEVSRISRGHIELRREPVELGALLRGAAESVRPLIERERHDFRLHVPREPVMLDGDPVRLTQVVTNLLTNAAKYTLPGGEVTATGERAGGEAVITVRDNGLGVPPTMLPHLFDMFAQVNRTLGRSQGGLGIGLALVRRLVELHGGRVEARSAGEGLGSEFVVRLPLAARRPMPIIGPHDAEPPASAPPQRILVVDDNADAADSLARLLRLRGHEVHVALDGEGALAAAHALGPDVVLLDLGMPGLDGYAVAARLQALGSMAPRLVALTGFGQADDRRRTREAGFEGHFVKPLDLAALERFLERAAAGAE